MNDVLSSLVSLREAREAFALATVVETRGSVSAQLGSKAVISSLGKVIAGWVGGGCAQSSVCHMALEALKDGHPRTIDLDLNDEVLGTGMPCGGSMSVFIDPIIPRQRLWILGTGRISEALCDMAACVGLEVLVFADPSYEARFPRASRVIVDDLTYSTLIPAADDFAVVATQHKGDHHSMLHLISSKVGYIGLIASKKRTGLVMEFLRGKGVSDTDLKRVYAPAGIDLGGAAAEEIALSILCEIMLINRKGSGRELRIVNGGAKLPGKLTTSL